MSRVEYRFRPITWVGKMTPAEQRRSRGSFRASWSDTLFMLETELGYLDAQDVVIQADMQPSDIRLDGMPRASARTPQFHGIIVSFTSHGRPMEYRTDVCEYWQHNVRSIALGLQALRAVDRYGITESGEQYVGWTAIGSEAHRIRPEDWSVDDACAFLEGLLDVPPDSMTATELYRRALRRAHPDTGGSADMFQQVKDAGVRLGL